MVTHETTYSMYLVLKQKKSIAYMAEHLQPNVLSTFLKEKGLPK